MTDRLTDEQKEWADMYAITFSKAAALNYGCGSSPEQTRELWLSFKNSYLHYVRTVPQDVRDGFSWDEDMGSYFVIFSEQVKGVKIRDLADHLNSELPGPNLEVKDLRRK